jgi:dynein heavy chain
LEEEIKTMELMFEHAPKKETKLVSSIDITISKVQEILIRTQVIAVSPYKTNFKDRLAELEHICKAVLEVLTEFDMFQKKWLFLRTIFSSDTVQDTLETEMGIWVTLDTWFKHTILGLLNNPQVWRLSQKEDLVFSLKRFIKDCEICKKSLVKFLEHKRKKFPRLYFLSNEELLSIYG